MQTTGVSKAYKQDSSLGVWWTLGLIFGLLDKFPVSYFLEFRKCHSKSLVTNTILLLSCSGFPKYFSGFPKHWSGFLWHCKCSLGLLGDCLGLLQMKYFETTVLSFAFYANRKLSFTKHSRNFYWGNFRSLQYIVHFWFVYSKLIGLGNV